MCVYDSNGTVIEGGIVGISSKCGSSSAHTNICVLLQKVHLTAKRSDRKWKISLLPESIVNQSLRLLFLLPRPLGVLWV